MKNLTKIAALALAACTLTACVEDQGVVLTEPVAKAPSTHPPENLAERTCTTALARELRLPASDLWIISTQFTDGQLWVTVHVPTAEQPWACVLDRNAKLIRTQYMGEG